MFDDIGDFIAGFLCGSALTASVVAIILVLIS